MEGFRQKDELDQLREKLPSLDSCLVLAPSMPAPLRELEPNELDVLQLAVSSAYARSAAARSTASIGGPVYAVTRMVPRAGRAPRAALETIQPIRPIPVPRCAASRRGPRAAPDAESNQAARGC